MERDRKRARGGERGRGKKNICQLAVFGVSEIANKKITKSIFTPTVPLLLLVVVGKFS